MIEQSNAENKIKSQISMISGKVKLEDGTGVHESEQRKGKVEGFIREVRKAESSSRLRELGRLKSPEYRWK